jgi:hypothetical protein
MNHQSHAPHRKTPRYIVPAGVPCCIRRVGELDWRDHTTTRRILFECYDYAEGPLWVFSADEWELRVPHARVYWTYLQ